MLLLLKMIKNFSPNTLRSMDVKYFLIVAVKYWKNYFQELQTLVDWIQRSPPHLRWTSLLPSLRVGYPKGSGALVETLQSEQWESKKFWICLAVGRDWHPFHSDLNPPYGSGGEGWGGLWTVKVKTWKHSWALTKSVNDCESWLP